MSRHVPHSLRPHVTSRDWTRNEATWRRAPRVRDMHDIYSRELFLLALDGLQLGRGRRTERARRFLAGVGEYDDREVVF